MKFEETHPDFQADIRRIAGHYNKTVQQVYDWWKEYSHFCQVSDQSAILWEFERWYENKLLADVA